MKIIGGVVYDNNYRVAQVSVQYSRLNCDDSEIVGGRLEPRL